ncbi:ImmA/IrrE family metallo-endopeptidase [Pseudarthrobacter enclensis]|uniref:ImmA/IrrE family metallo-endopeptidase n=1 Tax=Pseudarthrobacter enclensis TaxID=993070 RepID=UPI0036B8F61B
MPDGIAAMTDGVNIYVDDRLNAIQLKCAVLHEDIHIEHGHKTHQTEAVEMMVRYETARRLLPDMSNGCNGGSIKEAAISLGVTRQVLMDRAATLTDEQAHVAGCSNCRLCPAMQFRFSPSSLVS